MYDRIKNEVLNIIPKDAISCVAVHSKFMAIGTHSGKIHVMDHQGNKVHQDVLLVRGCCHMRSCLHACVSLLQHNSTVNQISIDSKGEFIASCSVDRAYIHGLLTTDFNLLINFDRPVRAIAIDPSFGRGTDRRFVTGDDKLILHSKNFLNRHASKIISSGDGQVRNIKWRGSFIAWATDVNVRIYDVSQKALIAVVKADHDTAQLRPDVYKCCLFWRDESTLLLGWADAVKVCRVKRKAKVSPDAPDKYVEITCMFSISFCISGVASLKEEIVLLVVDKDTLDSPGSTPQMMVMRPLESLECKEVSSDILSPKGYQAYTCKDYHLEALVDDEVFFIVCPKDIILAKPREDDDHIAWLVERSRYEEALEAILQSKKLHRFSYAQVGRQYVDFLIERGFDEDIEKAASLLPDICGTDRQLWEQLVRTFEAIDRLHSLADYLPVPQESDRWEPSFVLDHKVYESVLKSMMKSNSSEFVRLIDAWPAHLYDSKTVIHEAMSILQFDATNHDLLKGLAIIYTMQGRHHAATLTRVTFPFYAKEQSAKRLAACQQDAWVTLSF